MATHQLHYSYLLMEKYEELERARYKIRCLLRDKKDADAQFEELKDENTVLNDEKVHVMAVALVNHGNVLHSHMYPVWMISMLVFATDVARDC